MKNKRVLSVLISVFVLGSTFQVSAANDYLEVSPGDVINGESYSENSVSGEDEAVYQGNVSSNQDEGIDYILGRPMTEDEVESQESMVPDLVDLPEPDEDAEPVLDSPEQRATAGYENIGLYDLRDKGIISPVRSQVVGGPCWAFATQGLAESDMMKQGISNNPDLSEEHLMYFFYNRSVDPLGGTEGDRNVMNLNGYSFNTVGGNPQMASKFLATWSGVVDESVMPYTTSGSVTFDKSLEYLSDLHLQGARYIDASVDEIKNAIYTYGSPVAINYYHSSNYWNVNTGAYSCPVEKNINHSVIIVGWDDMFSKANFPEASGVKSDGAWIVKNSYGEDFQSGGYTYISYEDKTLSGATVMMFEPNNNYSHNYQYDGSSISSTVSVPVGASHSNVFTAKCNDDEKESLQAFGILIPSANVKLSVDVYKNLKNGSDPTSGTKVVSDYRVSTTHSGYYTFKLPTSESVANGNKFSIVVTNVSDEAKNFSLGISSSNTTNWIYFEEGVQKGQSFYRSKSTSTWRDMFDNYVAGGRSSNARIKAFTKTVKSSSITKPTGSPEPEDPVVSVGKVSIKSASAGTKSIKLNWSKAKNASSYEVYRKASGKMVLVGKTSNTTYTHKNLSPGRAYLYYVRGISGKHKGQYSNSKMVLTKPTTPTKVSMKKKGTKKAVLSFKKSTGASEYYVYSYNKGTKKYKVAYMIRGKKLYQYSKKNYVRVGKVRTKSGKIVCTLPNVQRKSNIKYCVRSYAGLDGLRSCSPYSRKVSVKR